MTRTPYAPLHLAVRNQLTRGNRHTGRSPYFSPLSARAAVVDAANRIALKRSIDLLIRGAFPWESSRYLFLPRTHAYPGPGPGKPTIIKETVKTIDDHLTATIRDSV